jgi:hypothetical protein
MSKPLSEQQLKSLNELLHYSSIKAESGIILDNLPRQVKCSDCDHDCLMIGVLAYGFNIERNKLAIAMGFTPHTAPATVLTCLNCRFVLRDHSMSSERPDLAEEAEWLMEQWNEWRSRKTPL